VLVLLVQDVQEVTEAVTVVTVVVAVVDADVVQDMALELLAELLELASVLEPLTPDWELAVIAHVEPQQPFIMYH